MSLLTEFIHQLLKVSIPPYWHNMLVQYQHINAGTRGKEDWSLSERIKSGNKGLYTC